MSLMITTERAGCSYPRNSRISFLPDMETSGKYLLQMSLNTVGQQVSCFSAVSKKIKIRTNQRKKNKKKKQTEAIEKFNRLNYA